MTRKFKKVNPVKVEEIVTNSLKIVGLHEVVKDKVSLLTRLIFSGLAYYFYEHPDSLIDLGYLRIRKNPDKEELFAVNILRDDRVVNAESLWKYYTGELQSKEELKSLLEGFVNELLVYSQIQETKISSLSNKISKQPRKEK